MTWVRLWAAWTGLALLLVACVGTASAGAAERALPSESMKLEVLDSVGNPENRAGAHPDRLVTHLATGTENGRVIEIEFPPGLGGDPSSVPACSRTAFDQTNCLPASQVGELLIVRPLEAAQRFPIYSLQPVAGEVVSLGVIAAFLRFKISGRLDDGDFALTMQLEGLPQSAFGEPVSETVFEFWGVPADHQQSTSIPRRPFLTIPTRCDRGPLTVGFRVRTWERPDEPAVGTTGTNAPLVGCRDLPFAPTVDFDLEQPVAETPTGFGLDLKFPQSADADALASSQASAARIEFPAGMAISPGAASRLTACSDAQLGRGTPTPAACPASSRVGTAEFGLPQLQRPLTGQVYIGQERSNERFRLFIVAASKEVGVEVKFVGAMRSDPETGRLSAVLADLPEIAVDNLLMRFDGGSRALFVAPGGCGPATANATVTPHSGSAPVTASDSVAVGPRPGRRCGERAPFAPTLVAATSARRGGRPTSFSTEVARRDGEQPTDRFEIAFPPGLSAGLSSVSLCPDPSAAAAECPPASRIGSAFVEIGSGPETAPLSGDAYLTGPYRGAPFGVALVFDAALGPFDLGRLTVRAALELDPLSGQVSVRTDSMPQSFQGIPVSFQAIGLEIDRPGLMRMPTSCAPMRVGARIASTEGAVASPSSELPLSGCVHLPFRPSFSLALTGRDQLHRLGKPGLRIAMRSKPGEASTRSVGLLLPSALRLGAAGLREICARRQALRGNCPKGARVGTGSGRTTLLKQPLKGAVYVVQPRGDGEPDLWVDLRGGGIELKLRSVTTVVNGRLETRFPALPDMPLSSFAVRFDGGEHGILTLQRGLCGGERELSAPATLEGHNGAQRRPRIPVSVPDGCPAG